MSDKIKLKDEVLKNSLQKEYLLSEIVFNLNNEKLIEKFKIIKKEILTNGFKNAASIYSISNKQIMVANLVGLNLVH